MKRREFVTFLCSATAIWPALGRSQAADRVRRIAVLIPFSGNDEFWQGYLAGFKGRLQALGWTDGRNARFDYRLVADRPEDIRVAADELLALKPDVVFVTTNPAVAIVTKATRAIPIVFASASDSVGSGFVASLAHPGGNVTGFQNYELSIIGKWMEVLNQLAPGIRRVGMIYDPQIDANVAFVRVAEELSGSLGLKVIPGGVHEGSDVERVLTAFAREPNGGLVVTPNPINTVNRAQIIALAAALKLPAVYPFRFFPASGGLASYGFDRMQQVREAAAYVDRILRGMNPGDLPVQLPTKYEFVINAKTAKALGLSIAQSVLSRADEVIE
jgi:putative tryptophan/tyrosine transport system substrate-binding protein